MLKWLGSAIIVALACSPSAALVVHGSGQLSSCVVTIGKFCPVESLGASLLGTAVLTGIVWGISFLFGGSGDQRRSTGISSQQMEQRIREMFAIIDIEWRRYASAAKSGNKLEAMILTFVTGELAFVKTSLPGLIPMVGATSIKKKIVEIISASGTHSREEFIVALRVLGYGDGEFVARSPVA